MFLLLDTTKLQLNAFALLCYFMLRVLWLVLCKVSASTTIAHCHLCTAAALLLGHDTIIVHFFACCLPIIALTHQHHHLHLCMYILYKTLFHADDNDQLIRAHLCSINTLTKAFLQNHVGGLCWSTCHTLLFIWCALQLLRFNFIRRHIRLPSTVEKLSLNTWREWIMFMFSHTKI